MREDLEIFEKEKEKGWFASIGAVNSSNTWIYIFIDPIKTLDINTTVADAWGLDLKKLITISLKFSGNYLNSVRFFHIFINQSKANIAFD